MSKSFDNDIELVDERDDNVTFVTNCYCMDSEHRILVDIGFYDYGTENEMIEMDIYKNLFIIPEYASHEWYYFYKRIWFRLKLAFKILFKGYVKLDGHFNFRSQQHIENFIKCIEYGIRKLENYQEKKEEFIAARKKLSKKLRERYKLTEEFRKEHGYES